MAQWRDVLYLISVTFTENSMGDAISVTDKRIVFTNKKSIRQSEFYQAQANGLKPEIAFEIRSIEYDGESKLEFNNKKYQIIRTYDKGEFTELICEGVVNNGNA